MQNSGWTIFVVDDERVISSTPTSILRSFGYQAFSFVNLSDAVAKAEHTKPELLITDILLSSDDGLTLAEQIRTMHPACKVVFMSRRADADILMSERRLNFSILPKPSHPSEVVAEVERLLGSE